MLQAAWLSQIIVASTPSAATSTVGDLSVFYDSDNGGLGTSSCNFAELALLLDTKPPSETEIALAETGLGVLEDRDRFVIPKNGVGDALSGVASISDAKREIDVVA